MYAVTYKNRVVLGPIEWNNGYIMSVMRSRYNEVIEIPFVVPDAEQFPLHVTADISIYPAEEDRDGNINPMIQQYHGPAWDITENKVTARYTIVPLGMIDARANHRDVAARLRWTQEHRGTTVAIGDQQVKISTHRSERSKWVETLQNMGDTVNWKFDQSWVTLTRSQVEAVAAAIHAHVQAAFDEEMRLHSLIEQCQNHDELLAITELQQPQAGN